MLLVLVAAGCAAAGPDPTAQMCAAATQLEDARLITAKAVVADQTGQAEVAQSLAQQARATAGQGNAGLQAVISDVQRGATWQALFMAYLHLGQAANALLPAYANTNGMSASELTVVDAQFAIAKTALPGSCFAAGVNQPDAAGP